MNQQMHPMTFGEKACGVSFNPGGNPDIDQIKRAFAAIIDDLYEGRLAPSLSSESRRMLSIAIAEAQTAQMWAVKAVTWQF